MERLGHQSREGADSSLSGNTGTGSGRSTGELSSGVGRQPSVWASPLTRLTPSSKHLPTRPDGARFVIATEPSSPLPNPGLRSRRKEAPLGRHRAGGAEAAQSAAVASRGCDWNRHTLQLAQGRSSVGRREDTPVDEGTGLLVSPCAQADGVPGAKSSARREKSNHRKEHHDATA